MLTVWDKINTKKYDYAGNRRKRGGRGVLALLRMHTEDSVGKVRTELMLILNVLFFCMYTAGNEEGF